MERYEIEEIESLQRHTDNVILKVKTSEAREELTEINIKLLVLLDKIKEKR